MLLGILCRNVAGLALILVAAAPGRASDDLRPEVRLPATVHAAVTLESPDTSLANFLEFSRARGVGESAIGDALRSNVGLMQAWIGITGIAAISGTDPWTAIGTMLGQGACLGVVVRPEADPAIILCSVARDRAQRDRLIDSLFTAMGQDAASNLRAHAGSEIKQLGDGLELCRIGDVMLIANDAALMNRAIDGRSPLSNAPWFAEARDAAPEDAIAWLAVDPALREMVPPAQLVPELAGEPLAGLLFGGWQAVLRDLAGISAAVRSVDGAMQFSVDLESELPLAASHLAFVQDADDTARWSAERIAGYIGEIDVRRDWATLIADREAFLTLPAAAKLVDFSTTLSSVMGRLDFVDDVMANVSGPVRLIAVDRSFDGARFRPVPSLPSFAFVSELRYDPSSDFERRVYSAGQIALSIISVDQSQKGEPGLLLEMDEHEGHRLVYGAYPDPPGLEEGGRPQVDVRYNFEPALMMVDGSLIIATSRELIEQIADVIEDGVDRAGASLRLGEAVDRLHVRAATMADALERNREALVVSRMLEEGRSRLQGELEIDALMAAIALIDTVDVVTRQRINGCAAELRVTPVPVD